MRSIVSHMHTDHYLDLVTLRYAYPWLEEAKKRLKVIVPPGSAEQLADLARGAGYPDFFARSFDFVEHDGERPFEIGGMRFEPHPTQHFVPTWGFRVDARGADEDVAKTFAYSADTAPTDAVWALVDRRGAVPVRGGAAIPGRGRPTARAARSPAARPRRARSRPAGRSAGCVLDAPPGHRRRRLGARRGAHDVRGTGRDRRAPTSYDLISAARRSSRARAI